MAREIASEIAAMTNWRLDNTMVPFNMFSSRRSKKSLVRACLTSATGWVLNKGGGNLKISHVN